MAESCEKAEVKIEYLWNNKEEVNLKSKWYDNKIKITEVGGPHKKCGRAKDV